jgi:hypothetical protein
MAMEMRRREQIAMAIGPTFFSHILGEMGIWFELYIKIFPYWV